MEKAEFLKNQLLIAKTALDAAFSLLEEEFDTSEPSRGCQHPEESRIDTSTMGHKSWICGDCGFNSEEMISGE